MDNLENIYKSKIDFIFTLIMLSIIFSCLLFVLIIKLIEVQSKINHITVDMIAELNNEIIELKKEITVIKKDI